MILNYNTLSPAAKDNLISRGIDTTGKLSQYLYSVKSNKLQLEYRRLLNRLYADFTPEEKILDQVFKEY